MKLCLCFSYLNFESVSCYLATSSMFTRTVRSSFQRAGPVLFGPVASRRLYSQSQSGGINHKRILVGLGLLAIGTTIYGTANPTKSPIAFVEPVTQRAFKDEDVSVIFVLGGPGAGKGTQCAKLVNNYGFVHLSAGDLLRAEQKREGSKYGEMISQYIRDGLIVPQEVTIALLEQAMKENVDKGKTRFLIDGFPRKMDQAKTFEEKVAKSKVTLFFDCPESVLLERLLKRGQTSGREDDNAESIKKRFKTFVETSMPVVEYFGEQGRVLRVSCDHPVDQVYSQVVSVLKEKGIFADKETEKK